MDVKALRGRVGIREFNGDANKFTEKLQIFFLSSLILHVTSIRLHTELEHRYCLQNH